MGEKKIKTTIPHNIYAILEKDIENFNITRNGFYNRIFKNLKHNLKDYEIKMKKSGKQSEKIVVSLNEDNKGDFYEFMRKSGAETDAEFMRSVIMTYITFPPYERERIIYRDKVDFIEEKSENKMKIYIKYKGEFRKIEPYFIAHSIEESHNYIYCWCEKKGIYLNYRISNIEEVKECEELQDRRDEEQIKNLKLNFDPFLSYGSRVKIKISEEGKSFFDRIHYNRPKLIDKQENIYEFECSVTKAKAYFPQFLNKVEIVEPIELREWMREEIRKMSKIYEEIE